MRKFEITILMCLMAVTTVLATTSWAQDDVVKWATKVSSQPVHPGEHFTAELSGAIEDGWHLYSITQPPGGPTTTVISVPPKQVLEAAGTITGPAPQKAYDPNFEMDTEFYEESASFKVPLVVDSKAKPGRAKAVIDVLFQVCNDTMCMPPTTVHVPLAITIAGVSKATKHPLATGQHLP